MNARIDARPRLRSSRSTWNWRRVPRMHARSNCISNRWRKYRREWGRPLPEHLQPSNEEERLRVKVSVIAGLILMCSVLALGQFANPDLKSRKKQVHSLLFM